jgi:hypothetical protein
LQQNNVWNDRFLHGGLANATSSSWHEVSKWQCVQPSYGVTRTWCKNNMLPTSPLPFTQQGKLCNQICMQNKFQTHKQHTFKQ